MTPLPFTLRQLELFAALAQDLSVRGCARRLGISHAAVSNQIALLEEQLGFDLVARQAGKGLELTAQGIAFAEDLRAFHAAADRLAAHRAEEPAEPCAGRFRVRIGLALFEHYVRPRLGHLLGAHPELEITFDTHVPGEARDPGHPEPEPDFALFHAPLGGEVGEGTRCLAQVRCAIYAARALVGDVAEALSPQAVSALPFILPAAGSDQTRAHLDGLARLGIVPRRIVGHCDDFDVMVNLVERGMGAACMTEPMIAPAIRPHLAALFPLENYRLMWRRRAGVEGHLPDLVADFLLGCVMDNPDYPAQV
ncbi:LysR family transcriptional regulator [Novosphingobium profundi]|uniref:LysR family transcriptional regulator n=1 Tax=Novosphingobium profundi TaxID=1774954 RepID=UPI001CFDD1B7|nr:LysR family transcriptional regulator [Novosphingobium profundi]